MREKGENGTPDTETPSHQRPPFADPLAEGADPTAPGSPHEPGGSDYRQSGAAAPKPEKKKVREG